MISVLLPVFNSQRYLAEALDSVLAQSVADFEVVTVDDGSSDASLDILLCYAKRDNRVRVISRPNTGIVGALNDGLAECRGEYIVRMDADDWSHPHRFAKQIDFMGANPHVVACGTDVHFTDPKGFPVKPCPRASDNDTIVKQLYEGNGGAIIHPSLIVRKEAISVIGGYRESALWIEDLDLYIRLSELGRLANISEYLLHYRQHRKSVNIVRNDMGRLKRKNDLMHEVHVNRGTSWEPISSLNQPSSAELFQGWATESLGYGHWFRSLKYAAQSIVAAPCRRQAWRTLKYVASAGYTISKQAKENPHKRYHLLPVDQTN